MGEAKSLIAKLPEVQGKYRENSDLSKTSWFRVGGKAEVLFKPADINDLQNFMKHKPDGVSVLALGACSNVIIRDGGIAGVVVKLGRSFAEMKLQDEDQIYVGAGSLDVNVAKFAFQESLEGLEFLSGIPGTIGGALAMNAGAYGREMKDVLIYAEAIDKKGELHRLNNADMKFEYRKNGIPESWIFVGALLQGAKGEQSEIEARMNEITEKRESTQPVRTRTGGSTFANPDPELSGGCSAWQCVDEVGGRGYTIGGAKMSEKHCNFMENTGDATARDLEELGDLMKARIKDQLGVEMHWEIKRIGQKA